MDRAVLIALLAIPIVVIIHIALFWQPIPWQGEMYWATSRDSDRPRLPGHWRSPEQALPSHFVLLHTSAQGS